MISLTGNIYALPRNAPRESEQKRINDGQLRTLVHLFFFIYAPFFTPAACLFPAFLISLSFPRRFLCSVYFAMPPLRVGLRVVSIRARQLVLPRCPSGWVASVATSVPRIPFLADSAATVDDDGDDDATVAPSHKLQRAGGSPLQFNSAGSDQSNFAAPARRLPIYRL